MSSPRFPTSIYEGQPDIPAEMTIADWQRQQAHERRQRRELLRQQRRQHSWLRRLWRF